jgi:Secretion system C-terminal sorting domain
MLGVVICFLGLRAGAQVPYWSQAPGPYGGTVVPSLVTLSNGNILAATRGGVFLSEDTGVTWVTDGDGILISDVRALMVLDNDRVLAGTYGGGLYMRTLGRTEWLPVGPRGQFVTSLGRTPGGTLLAGTIGDLLSSDDGGATWVQRPLMAVRAIAASVQYTFAATNQGVHRSADDGKTWQFTTLGFQEFDVLSLVVNARGSVFAGGNPTSGACAIYRSRGNGNIWTCVQPQTDPLLVPVLTVDAQDRLFAGGYRTVLSSDDEGDSWTGHPAGKSTINSLTGAGDIMLAGTFGFGLLRSNDGGLTWNTSNTGLSSTVKDLLADAAGSIYAATEGGVFISTDRGSTWDRVGGEDALVQPVTTLLKDDQNRLIAGTLSGAWRFSDTGGWEELGPPSRPAIRDLELGADGSIYAAYHSGLWRLRGKTWTDFPIMGTDQSPRDIVSVLEAEDGTVLVGASWDSWRRPAGEQTWSLLAMSGTPFFEISALTDRPSGRIVAGTRFFGVLESTDYGLTWNRKGSGLAGQEDIRSIGYDRAGRLHIGTFGSGIFQLNPWTNTWNPMVTGLDGHLRALSLAFTDRGDAFAGTFGGGLYRHLEGTSVATETQDEIPDDGLLLNVYPNPINSRGTVSITTRATANIRVDVYDLLGRRVASLADRTMMSGRHDLSLDMNSLSRGVYVIRLAAGGMVQTKTVVRLAP